MITIEEQFKLRLNLFVPVKYKGKNYYTINSFSRIIQRGLSTLYGLIKTGQIRTIKLSGIQLIPESEIYKVKLKTSGRRGKNSQYYMYTRSGKIKYFKD
jgi:hypothetical protein